MGGGVVKGKSHKQGGEHFEVESTGQHVEVEDEEGVICDEAMYNNQVITLKGTRKSIASQINESVGCKSMDQKLTSLKGGEFVIKVDGMDDEQIVEITGTRAQIASYINVEAGGVPYYATHLKEGGRINLIWSDDKKLFTFDKDNPPKQPSMTIARPLELPSEYFEIWKTNGVLQKIVDRIDQEIKVDPTQNKSGVFTSITANHNFYGNSKDVIKSREYIIDQLKGKGHDVSWILSRGDQIMQNGGSVSVVRPGGTPDFKEIPQEVAEIMPYQQQAFLKEAGLKEFQWVLQDLLEAVKDLPSRAPDKGGDTMVYLHYFYGSADWYIQEKDGDILYGFANIGDDQNAEFGTVYLKDLVEHGSIELDFHFTPTEMNKIVVGGNPYLIAPEIKIEEAIDPPGDVGYDQLEGYSFDFYPTSAGEVDGKESVIISVLVAKGATDIKVSGADFTNGLDFTYLGERYRIFDNTTEFKLENLTKGEIIETLYFSEHTAISIANKVLEIIDQSLDVLSHESADKAGLTIQELITGKNQFEINELIRSITEKHGTERNRYSPAEIELLDHYTGSGGHIKNGEKGARILDQFFTPPEVVSKMWGLAIEHGFVWKNAIILEPAVGSGRFLEMIPAQTIYDVVAYDVDKTSYTVCKVLYPDFDIRLGSFESLFFDDKRHIGLLGVDQTYDLVIGNPPYREYVSEYAPLGEKKATGAFTFDQYFIARGIDVLKPGGLLIYVVPNSFMHNDRKYNDFKNSLMEKADLIDAYRLPNGVFETTEVGTDILVFRKKVSTKAEGGFIRHADRSLAEQVKVFNEEGKVFFKMNEDYFSLVKELEAQALDYGETSVTGSDIVVYNTSIFDSTLKRLNAYRTSHLQGGSISDWLFIGQYPTGLQYADRRHSEHGDYKNIAFVFDEPQIEYATPSDAWRNPSEYTTYRLKVEDDSRPEYKELIQELKAKFEEKKEEGGRIYKHKHIAGLTIELKEPTSKGHKVKQTETHNPGGTKKLRNPKSKTAYFSSEEIEELFTEIMAKGGSLYGSKAKQLKFLRTKGNLVTFKKPFNWKGDPKTQIIVQSIDRDRGSVKIMGQFLFTPWYKGMDELIKAVDWDKMESWHKEQMKEGGPITFDGAEFTTASLGVIRDWLTDHGASFITDKKFTIMGHPYWLRDPLIMYTKSKGKTLETANYIIEDMHQKKVGEVDYSQAKGEFKIDFDIVDPKKASFKFDKGGQVPCGCLHSNYAQGGEIPKLKKVDTKEDFHHIRVRDPELFSEIRTPEWARPVANSVVKGAQVRSGKLKKKGKHEWETQAILIPVKHSKYKAKKFAEKILGKLEK